MDHEQRIAELESEVDRLKKAVVELVTNLNRVVRVTDTHGAAGPLASIRDEVMADAR